jgi:c-di-GMP-binding flagellar brake protein YcgR
MEKVEEIQGAAVLDLIKKLADDDTPMKMRFINDEYERFVEIAQIRKRKKTYYFLVKDNDNFRVANDDLDDLRIRFEFADKDNINYAFETGSDQISRSKIWIKLPEIIYRYQRRKYFRLEAPHGTKLYFKINDTSFNLLVINVSLGGTLGAMVGLTKEMELAFQKNSVNMLEFVELIFPSCDNDEDYRVNIKQCKIRRQLVNPKTRKLECAIEFEQIAEDQQKQLKAIFYQWQRDYLKRRKRFKV